MRIFNKINVVFIVNVVQTKMSFKDEAVKYFRRTSWRFGQSRRICSNKNLLTIPWVPFTVCISALAVWNSLSDVCEWAELVAAFRGRLKSRVFVQPTKSSSPPWNASDSLATNWCFINLFCLIDLLIIIIVIILYIWQCGDGEANTVEETSSILKYP